MALVLWLLAALVPGLIGMGALRILYGSQRKEEFSPADWILTGANICVGLAEAAHLGAVILGWSFSCCVKVFAVAVAAVLMLAAVVELVSRRKSSFLQKAIKDCGSEVTNAAVEKEEASADADENFVTGSVRDKWKQWHCKGNISWAFFALLVLMQLIYVLTARGVYVEGDLTLETVQSFLGSDRIYQVNPLTGSAYAQGIPLRLKILCLPTLYGALSRLLGLDPRTLVYGLIPGLVLIGSYLAFATVGKYFFPEDARRRGLFLVFVALLLSTGGYLCGMDGFGLLHSGFRGVTIRGGILLPYTFGLILRKKYKLLLLCILAEVCMVWTFYGLGVCVLVTAGMLTVSFICRGLQKGTDKAERRKR